MDSRVIKTSNFHKEVDKQEKLLRDALQCELNKIKARNKKTAMQNDVNEMIRNSCDVITPEVMEKNVKAKTLSNTPKMVCATLFYDTIYFTVLLLTKPLLSFTRMK